MSDLEDFRRRIAQLGPGRLRDELKAELRWMERHTLEERIERRREDIAQHEAETSIQQTVRTIEEMPDLRPQRRVIGRDD